MSSCEFAANREIHWESGKHNDKISLFILFNIILSSEKSQLFFYEFFFIRCPCLSIIVPIFISNLQIEYSTSKTLYRQYTNMHRKINKNTIIMVKATQRIRLPLKVFWKTFFSMVLCQTLEVSEELFFFCILKLHCNHVQPQLWRWHFWNVLITSYGRRNCMWTVAETPSTCTCIENRKNTSSSYQLPAVIPHEQNQATSTSNIFIPVYNAEEITSSYLQRYGSWPGTENLLSSNQFKASRESVLAQNAMFCFYFLFKYNSKITWVLFLILHSTEV